MPDQRARPLAACEALFMRMSRVPLVRCGSCFLNKAQTSKPLKTSALCTFALNKQRHAPQQPEGVDAQLGCCKQWPLERNMRGYLVCFELARIPKTKHRCVIVNRHLSGASSKSFWVAGFGTIFTHQYCINMDTGS